MLKTVIAFTAGFLLGGFALPLTTSARQPVMPSRGSPPVQLRTYTIDKGRLDDFAAAWRAGVYPLRLKMGYRIPFAAKVPATNQFVWVVAYDGPEPWETQEAAYYGSAERKAMSPDPAQWIARPEQVFVQPVVDAGSGRAP